DFVEKSQFWFDRKKVPVTVSVGVYVAVPNQQDDGDILLKKADEALYAAKRNGRNRVEVYSEASSAANA
ncbi:MAG: GGDEF domain-containing protein, partial [Pseudomonadales bacterium]|nr:GGDEF domain-containing protein [Pseudomonadales bacterium]